MQANPVDDWYNSDNKLKEIIDTISLSDKSVEEQARDAFLMVSDSFHLPKYPEDLEEDDYAAYEEEGIIHPRTVFEEVGIIRYLEPEDDPRGIVLCALHNIKHRTYVDIDDCAIRHFGGKKKIPKEYMVYFTGKDADSKLHFLKEGESWVQPGVKCALAIIKQDKNR